MGTNQGKADFRSVIHLSINLILNWSLHWSNHWRGTQRRSKSQPFSSLVARMKNKSTTVDRSWSLGFDINAAILLVVGYCSVCIVLFVLFRSNCSLSFKSNQSQTNARYEVLNNNNARVRTSTMYFLQLLLVYKRLRKRRGTKFLPLTMRRLHVEALLKMTCLLTTNWVLTFLSITLLQSNFSSQPGKTCSRATRTTSSTHCSYTRSKRIRSGMTHQSLTSSNAYQSYSSNVWFRGPIIFIAFNVLTVSHNHLAQYKRPLHSHF